MNTRDGAADAQLMPRFTLLMRGCYDIADHHRRYRADYYAFCLRCDHA